MICPMCGDEYRVEVLEYFAATREFILDACCEGAHEDAVEDMQTWTRAEWKAWLAQGAGIYVRQVVAEDGALLLDCGHMQVRAIAQREARDFIDCNHRHNRAPIGWKFGAGIYNDADLVGVVWVGRPVARALDDGSTLEINRCCVAPTGLAWNACSQLYGWACREAERLGYRKVITYTLESEKGSSLKASNFTPVARTKGGTWNCPSRPRTDKAPTCRKIRWQRDLRPKEIDSGTPTGVPFDLPGAQHGYSNCCV